MTAPSLAYGINAATANTIATTAPSGSGGLLVFIGAHDTGSTEPFGRINDFGPGTPDDETGHLISNYTAMPAAANVLQVWSKPDSGSEPGNYDLDIYDAASGGSLLSRATIFAVLRVTHPDGVPTVAHVAVDVNDAGSANEPVNPSVTTDSADNLIAYIVGWDEGKTLSGGGAPAGTTQLFHSDQSLHDLLLNYKTQASPGASGTGSWNISSGTRWCAVTIAFAPPAGGGGQTVTPTGLASTFAFGSPSAAPGNVNVTPSGLASSLAFGTPTALPGNVNVSVTGLASTLAFGTPTADLAPLVVTPSGIASTFAFGSPTALPGGVTVSPTGLASTLAFGTPTAAPGAVSITPAGLPSTLAFGAPTALPGNVDVAVSGLASTLVFGEPTAFLPPDQIVLPSGLASSFAFGAPTAVVEGWDPGQPPSDAWGSSAAPGGSWASSQPDGGSWTQAPAAGGQWARRPRPTDGWSA